MKKFTHGKFVTRRRNADDARLKPEDEEKVRSVLVHHPAATEKMGSGIDHIKVMESLRSLSSSHHCLGNTWGECSVSHLRWVLCMYDRSSGTRRSRSLGASGWFVLMEAKLISPTTSVWNTRLLRSILISSTVTTPSTARPSEPGRFETLETLNRHAMSCLHWMQSSLRDSVIIDDWSGLL